MINILFTIIILSLIAFLSFREYANAKERKQLIHAIMAKNLNEKLEADIIADEKPIKPEKPSDLVPAQDLSDEDFDKMIERQLKKQIEG